MERMYNSRSPVLIQDTAGEECATSSYNVAENTGIAEGAEGRGNGDILVFCDRDGEMHILSITKQGTLGDVYDMLKEKWTDICPEDTSLHYYEPEGGFRVELKSNSDVEHMYRVHEMMKKGTCKMVACRVVAPNKRTRYDEHVV